MRCRDFPYTPSDFPYRGECPGCIRIAAFPNFIRLPLANFRPVRPGRECPRRAVGGRTRIQEGFRLRRSAGQTECPPASVPYPTKDKSRGGTRVLRQTSAARPLPKGRAPRAPKQGYRAELELEAPGLRGRGRVTGTPQGEGKPCIDSEDFCHSWPRWVRWRRPRAQSPACCFLNRTAATERRRSSRSTRTPTTQTCTRSSAPTAPTP